MYNVCRNYEDIYEDINRPFIELLGPLMLTFRTSKNVNIKITKYEVISFLIFQHVVVSIVNIADCWPKKIKRPLLARIKGK